MAALVDSNILVYRFDARFPEKQRIVNELLREGVATNSLRVPHQAILEFVAATTRRIRGGDPLLTDQEAWREAEEMLSEFSIVYPNATILRTALRGAATYQLSWFDAHLWAYAEFYCLDRLYSEDFQHGRVYGTVRCVNPFAN